MKVSSGNYSLFVLGKTLFGAIGTNGFGFGFGERTFPVGFFPNFDRSVGFFSKVRVSGFRFAFFAKGFSSPFFSRFAAFSLFLLQLRSARLLTRFGFSPVFSSRGFPKVFSFSSRENVFFFGKNSFSHFSDFSSLGRREVG